MATVTKQATMSVPSLERVRDGRSRPVLFWASLGAFFVALQTYIFASWLLSGDVKPIHTGVTPVPSFMKVAGVTQELVMAAGMLAVLILVVIRPKLRTGKFSFDGLLVFAMFWLWWQDPLFNYVSNGFNFGSQLLNVNSWAGHIPGWSAPNADRIPQPLVWDLGFYLFLGVAAMIFASNMMGRVKARRPQTTAPTLLFWCFLFFVVADFLLEMLFVVTGVYVYGGITKGWTLFGGHYYQFPLYEPIGVGVLGTGWTAVRYFRNERGQALSERGLEEVRVGRRSHTTLRWLSLVGMLNVVFLLGYSVLIQAWQIHPGPWPADIQKRSYFMNGLCGAGSTYACTGLGVAVPTPHGAHIGPSGQVVVPRGAVTPRLIPFATR